MALLALPAPAAGTVVTLSRTRAELAGQPARTGFYDYATGTPRTWTTRADFAAGTLAGTRDDLVPGSLTLDPIGPPGTTLPDLIGAGLLQADAGDLRAVAADGATQLDPCGGGVPARQGRDGGGSAAEPNP